MLKQFILAILCFIVVNAFSQTTDTTSFHKDNYITGSRIDEDIIEEYNEKNETSYDFSDMEDESLQIYKHPININKATEEELKQLHLNELQIWNIQDYITKYGEITSIYELNMIEGFDSTLIRRLEPCILFRMDQEIYKITLPNLLKQGKHTILSRYQRTLQLQKGYISNTSDASSSTSADQLTTDNSNNNYIGNQIKLLAKYSYNFHNRLKFGITLEKDAGESLNNGFDFCSLHFYYKSKHLLKNLALGDYNLQFGQGLTMHSGFGFSKNPSVALISRRVNQIRPSTGANENGFFRGGAITVSPIHNLDVTMFYSNRKLDADFISVFKNDSVDNTISSLTESGLHRTPLEISKKNAISQIVFGGNIQSYFSIFKLGATAYSTSLSSEMSPRDLPYNLYRFRGNKLTNFGTDISVIYRLLTAFAEISGSDNGAKAFMAGVSFQPSPLYGFSFLYRNYAPDYQNFFSNAFSENSSCSNENGFYLGLSANLRSYLDLTAYADYYQFPWLKYLVDAPSCGKEYMLQLKYHLSTNNEILIRYSFQQGMQNLSSYIALKKYSTLYNPADPDSLNKLNLPFTYEAGGVIDLPCFKEKHDLRLNLIYSLSKSLVLKNRIEYAVFKSVDKGISSGFIIYQDLIYHNLNSPMLLNLRYALFDTDSYNERLYTYESDVLYSFSTPAYYFKGSRFYIMLKYDVNRSLDIWLRYSQSYYSNKNSIGSGLEEIKGNTKSELKLQLMVKF